MKNISMQEIADQLGVSKNSVSQALRDTNLVSEELKFKVRKLAQDLGYVYKEKASKISGEIALVTSTFALQQVSFFGEIIKYLQFYGIENHRKIEIIEITEEMLEKEQLPANLKDFEGLFVISHLTDDYIVKLLKKGIPTVIVDHHSFRFSADCVLTKNTDGAYLAVKHLIDKGCRTIGFIGDIAFSPSYLERYRGYERALADHDLPLNEKIAITQIRENQGELFKRLKGVETIPDAWFCVNSGLAFMLNYYLQSRGQVIPRDTSIICFDETEFNHMAKPQLTNVSTDLRYMAKISMETLLERIKNPEAPFVHKQIVPTLNLLESVKS